MIVFDDYRNFLSKIIINDNYLIITDDTLFKIYHDELKDFEIFVIESGEESKSLDIVSQVVEDLIAINATRDFVLIGLGGGVICDLTAFIASIYKRGIKHILIPTSLLAMCDASIGGKTGINHVGIKNVIGTFKNADDIIIDTSFLKSLSEEHFKNGLSEIIKMSLIGGDELYEMLQSENYNINLLIEKSIQFKHRIVENDKYDKGNRQILNFGHTFGHAIESEFNLLHGFAVAIGMKIAIYLSEELTINDKIQIISLIEKHVYSFKIDFDFDRIEKYIRNDKKNSSKIKLILLKSIGNPYIAEFTIEKLEKAYNDLCFNRY